MKKIKEGLILLSWLVPLLVLTELGEFFMILAAILLHEGGHLFGFWLLGKPPPAFRGAYGGMLLTPRTPLSYKGELTVLLCGPLFNIAATLLLPILFPKSEPLLSFSVIHLLCALSSLLPLPDTDGSRALFDLLALFLPLRIAEGFILFLTRSFSFLLIFSLLFLLLFGGGALVSFLLFSILLRLFSKHLRVGI